MIQEGLDFRSKKEREEKKEQHKGWESLKERRRKEKVVVEAWC